MNTQLAKVLFNYRVTPQLTTWISPAELLHRQPRTRLDLLRPNTPLRVEEKQQVQKRKHDLKARARLFQNGDLVYVKNFSPGPQWVPGKVIEVSGPVSYVIQLNDGRQRRCHLRARMGDADTEEMSQIIPEDSIPFTPRTTSMATETATRNPYCSVRNWNLWTDRSTSMPTFPSVNDSGHRYPRRNRKPREHFESGTNWTVRTDLLLCMHAHFLCLCYAIVSVLIFCFF